MVHCLEMARGMSRWQIRFGFEVRELKQYPQGDHSEG
jgi:hypothetical protein